jgi:hypothetical protein
VILSDPRQVMIERVERGRAEHADLPHRAP